jgi:hypothetical protein
MITFKSCRKKAGASHLPKVMTMFGVWVSFRAFTHQNIDTFAQILGGPQPGSAPWVASPVKLSLTDLLANWMRNQIHAKMKP